MNSALNCPVSGHLRLHHSQIRRVLRIVNCYVKMNKLCGDRAPLTVRTSTSQWWKKLIAKCGWDGPGKWRNPNYVLNCFVDLFQSRWLRPFISRQRVGTMSRRTFLVRSRDMEPTIPHDGMLAQFLRLTRREFHLTNVIHSGSTNQHFLWGFDDIKWGMYGRTIWLRLYFER